MVQSWKASYEGNSFVGENVVDVPRWVCSKSKEGSESAKIENIWSKKS